MNTLDEKGIEFANLLATNPQTEFGGGSRILGEETRGVVLHCRNTSGLNPNIAHEITLGTNRDGNLVVGSECTDVVHALGLHREVGVSLVVLTEEADFRLTSDVHILGTHRHKID
tara:strand:- start:9211 stop:9555 length:345 start_codon:yes stop_codon:yes gene_type:complete